MINTLQAKELDQKIQLAREAQAEQEKADAIKAGSDSLDALLKEKAKQDAIQAAELQLNTQRDRATERLAGTALEATQWQKDFIQLCDTAERLAGQLKAIQKDISSCAYAIKRGVDGVYYLQNGPSDKMTDGNPIPEILSGAPGFEAEWYAVGGQSPELACFPAGLGKGGISTELRDLLLKLARVRAYNPQSGAGHFLRVR